MSVSLRFRILAGDDAFHELPRYKVMLRGFAKGGKW
jgi:hypothetical protein